MSLSARLLTPVADVIGAAMSLAIGPFAALVAKGGAQRLPLTHKVWDKFGVTPIRYHY